MSTATETRNRVKGKFVKREVHSGDIPIAQPSPVRMPLDGPMERPSPDFEVSPPEALKDKDYLDKLAFNEQRVKIMIQPSAEENAPLFIEGWCQGRGIEIWSERLKVWQPLGSVPVGVPVVIKRKYLEVLAKAKREKVTTIVVQPASPSDDFRNLVTRATAMSNQITLLEDTPEGYDWYRQIISDRG